MSPLLFDWLVSRSDVKLMAHDFFWDSGISKTLKAKMSQNLDITLSISCLVSLFRFVPTLIKSPLLQRFISSCFSVGLGLCSGIWMFRTETSSSFLFCSHSWARSLFFAPKIYLLVFSRRLQPLWQVLADCFERLSIFLLWHHLIHIVSAINGG